MDGATPGPQPEPQPAGGVEPRILLSHPGPGKPGTPTAPSMPRRRAVRALKHSSLWAYRLCVYSLLAAVLLVGTCVLGLRYWLLPNIDQYSPQISAAISRAAKQRIVIGMIRGDWDGLRPRLELQDVRLYDAAGGERLVLASVDSTLAWASLLALEPMFHSIELSGLAFEVRRDVQGTLQIAGISLDGGGEEDAGLADWLLRQHRIALHDSQVIWVDETLGGTPLELKQVELQVQRVFRRNRFGLRAVPPLEVASPIDLRGDLDGGTVRDLRQWNGQLYLQIGYADLAALRQWVPLPLRIERGAGGMEVWADLEAGRVHAATADVGLSAVRMRLRADLPELELDRLQGRLAWRTRPEYLEVSAQDLSFATPDGLALAPADIRYVRAGGEEDDPDARYAIEFDALDVAAVTRLVDRVPVDATLRARLAELQPRGMVTGCRVAWRGQVAETGEYSIRAGFEKLAVRASGPIPGVAQVSGTLRADQDGGSLTLRAGASVVDMPQVFVGPLPLDALDARLRWSMPGGLPLVRIDSVAFSSAHLEGSLAGTYQAQAHGPGRVDLTSSLARVEGVEAWRYLPLIVHDDVRHWLQQAIAAGQLRDARVTLRGELQRFPFSDGTSGEFEVVGRMQNGKLVYAPRWPALDDISGRLLVRGPRLTAEIESARVFGARLGPATAVLPDFGSHEPVVQVRGDAEGTSADLLRYIAESPIEGAAGRVSRSLQVTGAGRLALSLEVPLKHAVDTQVSGRYRFADNVLVGAGMPRLEQLGGVLSFTRDDLTIREGSARVLGMPARFTLDRQPGAGVVIRGTGRAEMASLRRELDLSWMASLAGTTDWSATVKIGDDGYDLLVQSNLRGVSSQLPPPLSKAAGGTLPFRLERRPRGSEQDLLVFAVGKILSGQLAYNRSDPGRVVQGELRLGSDAPAPQRDGVWLAGQLDYFDWDRWHSVLGGSRSGDGDGWAGMDLRANRTVAFSRDWTDTSIEARRTDAVWQVSVAGREAAGALTWNPAGQGSLAGRFSRLYVPASGPVLQPPVAGDADPALPSLDLIADDFRLGERQFGRLVLRAVPDRALWRIEQLDLHSPEGRIGMTGTWEAWVPNPTTRIDVQVEVVDIGGYFARLKLPEGIKGGSGRLEGKLSWNGPPSALDLASLTGELTLDAKNGQFVRLEPGIGKLVGVLSLQALPRRVSLDFRDVFSEGFRFDEIRASADIQRGVAHTEDFRMVGTSARVDMKGSLDLARETQSLQVRVIPSLSESVALGAAIVNPAVGLATLFAQKALKDPINQMVSVEYLVSGTWADPVVANKKRDQPADGKQGRQ